MLPSPPSRVWKIGRWVSAPYYCLNICGIAWGFALYMHMALTGRTATGLGVKIGLGSAIVLWATNVLASYVQGV